MLDPYLVFAIATLLCVAGSSYVCHRARLERVQRRGGSLPGGDRR